MLARATIILLPSHPPTTPPTQSPVWNPDLDPLWYWLLSARNNVDQGNHLSLTGGWKVVRLDRLLEDVLDDQRLNMFYLSWDVPGSCSVIWLQCTNAFSTVLRVKTILAERFGTCMHTRTHTHTTRYTYTVNFLFPFMCDICFMCDMSLIFLILLWRGI